MTYPFHLGVFSSGLYVVLLFVRVPFEIIDYLWMMRVIDTAVIFLGAAGLILGTYGCAGLLVKRIFDPGLSTYTSPREYFNLCVILLVFVLGLILWLGTDQNFTLSRQYVYSLVTLSTPPEMEFFIKILIVLFSAFIASLPFGSLQHGIAKFFTYHLVRWDSEPNTRGSKLESILVLQLNRPVTWSAQHIDRGRWKDVVNTKELGEKKQK